MKDGEKATEKSRGKRSHLVPDAELERLKRDINLVALVRSYGVDLKASGKDLIGKCPFHEDSHASLVVSPDKNLWHCMGACNIGGSTIDWVMRVEKVGFRRAVEVLRERVGGSTAADCNTAAEGENSAAPADSAADAENTADASQSPANPATKGKSKAGKTRLASPVEMTADEQKLLSQVADYYHETLLKTTQPKDYLASRGIAGDEVVKEFKIGFADRSLGMRIPHKQVKAGKEMREHLQKLGILRESGHEHMTGSVVFPITDESGQITGMYGRKICNKLRAGTPIHLYLSGPHRGMFNAKCLHASRELIVCEAIIDALSFWVHGLKNVTAAFGTNGFTDEMLESFVNHNITKVYIAFDADPAGDKAAIELAQRLGEKNIACLRIQFPQGMDANDFIRTKGFQPEMLQELVDKAVAMNSPAAKEENEPVILPTPEPQTFEQAEPAAEEENLAATLPTPEPEMREQSIPIPTEFSPLAATPGDASSEFSPLAAPSASAVRQSELLTRLRDFFHQRLSSCEVGKAALQEHGLLHAETVNYFKLGFDDGKVNQALTPDVTGDLREMGAINDKHHSRFYQCLTVGLEDGEGNVVGLYGLRPNEENGKSETWARSEQEGIFHAAAYKANVAMILTHGLWEALAMWRLGFRNVGAILSKNGVPALLLDQLARYSVRQVYLLHTDDRANEATSARFVRAVGHLGLDVRRVKLPRGMSVSDLLLRHGQDKAREGLQKLLAEATALTVSEEGAGLPLAVEWQGRKASVRGATLFYELEILGRESGAARVVLTASHDGRYHTDKLDLFRSQARAAFAANAAKRFQLPGEHIERELEEILLAVRQVPLRLPETKDNSKAETVADSYSKEELATALSWLKRPDFFAQIPRDYDILGYVGEDKAKQLIYVAASSRKLDEPLPMILCASSAGGKTALMTVTARLMPDADVLYLSEISRQALYYMNGDRLKHRLIIVDERHGSEEADYAIRTLLSRGVLRKAVPVKDSNGEMQTVIRELSGPVGYMESTTQAEIHPENENRCLVAYLDDGEEQTTRIHVAQRESFTPEGRKRKREAQQVVRRHKAAQSLLKPCKVDIPYVRHITFPTRWCRTRRDHQKFLLLVAGIAYLHQYQRQQYQEGSELVVVSGISDYRLAYELAPLILMPAVSDITDKHYELLSGVDAYVTAQAEESKLGREDVVFTRSDLSRHLGWQLHDIKNYLPRLVEMDYLTMIGNPARGSTFRYRRNYSVPDPSNPLNGLITPEALAMKIAKVAG